MSQKITYGLRHRDSGYLVRVTGADDLGHQDGSVSMIDGDGYNHEPRLEFEDPADLIATLRENTRYYNTNRRRPGWGNVDVERCVPVAIIREDTRDAAGGDPIRSTETIRKAVLPRHFAGKTRTTRQTTPPSIMRRTFGAELAKISEGDHIELAIVAASEGEFLAGTTFESPNTAQICEAVAIVPLPGDWPGSIHDAYKEGDRLILARSNNMSMAVAIVDFEPEDFAPAAVPTL